MPKIFYSYIQDFHFYDYDRAFNSIYMKQLAQNYQNKESKVMLKFCGENKYRWVSHIEQKSCLTPILLEKRDFAEILFESSKNNIINKLYMNSYKYLFNKGLNKILKGYQNRSDNLESEDEKENDRNHENSDSDGLVTESSISSKNLTVYSAKKIKVGMIDKDDQYTLESHIHNPKESNQLVIPTAGIKKVSSFRQEFRNRNKRSVNHTSTRRKSKPERQKTKLKIDLTKAKIPILFQNEDSASPKVIEKKTKDNSDLNFDDEGLSENSTPEIHHKKISKFVTKPKKRLNNRFYYKNCLIIDREFSNAIFEIFEPEYNYDISSDSSEKSESYDLENIQSPDVYPELINMQIETQNTSKNDESKEHVNDLAKEDSSHLKSLLEGSNSLVRARHKQSTKIIVQAKLFGDKSLKNLMKKVPPPSPLGNQVEISQETSSIVLPAMKTIYKATDNPELLFRRSNSNKSENLSSVTSQYKFDDEDSDDSDPVFDYNAESALNISSKKIPLKEESRAINLINYFKNRSTTNSMIRVDLSEK